jgi:pimeloyl-ACP methyl ester carboxylesterase
MSRMLYLHGFASSAASKKGVAVAARMQGVMDVERLDLRVPSLERLDFGAMVAKARAAIDGPVWLVGSSLGGLTAARVAALDDRVLGLVLMAPAFGFGERWKARLGEDGWRRWMDEGWLTVHDHATGGETRVHADFARGVLEWDRDDGGYPAVTVPARVFHGVLDDVVPVDASRRWAAAQRDATVVELDDGHDLVASLPVILDGIEAFTARPRT